MTTINTVTEVSIEAEVKQIFIDAGWATAPYMSVKACESGGSAWRRGKANGMFSIDVWGARNTVGGRNTREHMFRTKKDGTFSAETLTKIKEFAEYRLDRETAKNAAEKVREIAKASNAKIAEELREYAHVTTGSYYSCYSSTCGSYITEDSGISGKVKVNAGDLMLTEDQARQFLQVIAAFKRGELIGNR